MTILGAAPLGLFEGFVFSASVSTPKELLLSRIDFCQKIDFCAIVGGHWTLGERGNLSFFCLLVDLVFGRSANRFYSS